MKAFKIFDTWFSVCLIAGCIIMTMVAASSEMFFLSYFIVGGWQVISAVVHLLKKWFPISAGRQNYCWLLAVIALWTLLGLLINALFIPLCLILTFIAPFMALYYTRLCYNETYVGMQRPLAQLR